MYSHYTHRVHSSKHKEIQHTKQRTGMKKTTREQVVNLHVTDLRRKGYNSLQKWLERDPAVHLYIGRDVKYVQGARESKWHNPFTLAKNATEKQKTEALASFREHIRITPSLWDNLEDLEGKVLGCWCAPRKCHGHVLLELLAEKKERVVE